MESAVINVGMFETLALTVLVIYLGNFLRAKIPVLKQYCIPSAVVGGTLVSILICILYVGNIVSFTFDSSTMNTFFYNIFFAASGAAASMALLKKGGKLVIIFAILAAILATLQNVLAVGVGVGLFDMNPLTALMAGSTPLTGGHGNAASFGPQAVAAGGVGALEVAVAAATFGLISGCMIGGPMGRRLIRKNRLAQEGSANAMPAYDGLTQPELDDPGSHPVKAFMSAERSTKAAFLLLLACGVGELLFNLLKGVMPSWFSLPIHVMCMFGGILVRVILDSTKGDNEALYESIDTIGEISLALFVSMSIMTMKLWQLAELALPLITILALQLVLIYVFCTQITFRLCGKNYDAAIIATGHSGFGLGAVPVSMATMTAVCERYHYSKLAFFVVPVIGGFLSNITNAVIISGFISFCSSMLG